MSFIQQLDAEQCIALQSAGILNKPENKQYHMLKPLVVMYLLKASELCLPPQHLQLCQQFCIIYSTNSMLTTSKEVPLGPLWSASSYQSYGGMLARLILFTINMVDAPNLLQLPDNIAESLDEEDDASHSPINVELEQETDFQDEEFDTEELEEDNNYEQMSDEQFVTYATQQFTRVQSSLPLYSQTSQSSDKDGLELIHSFGMAMFARPIDSNTQVDPFITFLITSQLLKGQTFVALNQIPSRLSALLYGIRMVLFKECIFQLEKDSTFDVGSLTKWLRDNVQAATGPTDSTSIVEGQGGISSPFLYTRVASSIITNAVIKSPTHPRFIPLSAPVPVIFEFDGNKHDARHFSIMFDAMLIRCENILGQVLLDAKVGRDELPSFSNIKDDCNKAGAIVSLLNQASFSSGTHSLEEHFETFLLERLAGNPSYHSLTETSGGEKKLEYNTAQWKKLLGSIEELEDLLHVLVAFASGGAMRGSTVHLLTYRNLPGQLRNFCKVGGIGVFLHGNSKTAWKYTTQALICHAVCPWLQDLLFYFLLLLRPVEIFATIKFDQTLP
ncbi:hypothetical protein FRB99_007740 [Tulasnella sp. 403]|nr:hypothetical protein FRB99_007740 [Tulasnella sp. 403]